MGLRGVAGFRLRFVAKGLSQSCHSYVVAVVSPCSLGRLSIPDGEAVPVEASGRDAPSEFDYTCRHDTGNQPVTGL
jgi:hypothetical protein